MEPVPWRGSGVRGMDEKASSGVPSQATVPDDLAAVEFMVKDSKRFPDSNGCGYADFRSLYRVRSSLSETTPASQNGLSVRLPGRWPGRPARHRIVHLV